MSDLRELLEVAAGPVGRGFDYSAIVQRARTRRRNRVAIAGVLATVALLVATVPWLGGSSSLDLDMRRDVTPADESGGLRPAPKGGVSGGDAPVVAGPAGNGPSMRPTPPTPPAAAQAPADAGVKVSGPTGRVAFTRSGDVYVADLDMTDQVLIATAAHSPAWSPDGSKLAFVLRVFEEDPADARRSGTGHLAIADAGGGGVTVIRDDGSRRGGWSVDSPVWSPDGSRIAFVQRYCDSTVNARPVVLPDVPRDGACRPDTPEEEDGGRQSWSEIRSVRVDGGDDERVLASTPNTYSEAPSFSPDGTRIVFARAGNVVASVWDLYVARADGSSATNITSGLDGGGSDYGPAWSPDGRWIAFTAASAGPEVECGARSSAVALIAPDGADRHSVSHGVDGCASEPAWHPDGGAIVFTRRVDGNRAAGQLWVLSPPGANGLQIHIGPGIEAAVRPT